MKTFLRVASINCLLILNTKSTEEYENENVEIYPPSLPNAGVDAQSMENGTLLGYARTVRNGKGER